MPAIHKSDLCMLGHLLGNFHVGARGAGRYIVYTTLALSESFVSSSRLVASSPFQLNNDRFSTSLLILIPVAAKGLS